MPKRLITRRPSNPRSYDSLLSRRQGRTPQARSDIVFARGATTPRPPRRENMSQEPLHLHLLLMPIIGPLRQRRLLVPTTLELRLRLRRICLITIIEDRRLLLLLLALSVLTILELLLQPQRLYLAIAGDPLRPSHRRCKAITTEHLHPHHQYNITVLELCHPHLHRREHMTRERHPLLPRSASSHTDREQSGSHPLHPRHLLIAVLSSEEIQMLLMITELPSKATLRPARHRRHRHRLRAPDSPLHPYVRPWMA